MARAIPVNSQPAEVVEPQVVEVQPVEMPPAVSGQDHPVHGKWVQDHWEAVHGHTWVDDRWEPNV